MYFTLPTDWETFDPNVRATNVLFFWYNKLKWATEKLVGIIESMNERAESKIYFKIKNLLN